MTDKPAFGKNLRYSKCTNSFLPFRLRKFRVLDTLVLQFVTSSILTLWLCCSPVYFPGSKEKDFIIIVKVLKRGACCSRINKNKRTDFIGQGHFDAGDKFLNSVLCNVSHRPYSSMFKVFSHPSTRFKFRLLLCLWE